jgi:putative SOS response-associated peptidase YedK
MPHFIGNRSDVATVGRGDGPLTNRMPLIVQPEHYGWWLDSDGLFREVLNHPDKDELYFATVNRALSNPRNEGPELLKPSI